jgi:hypothetical protein
MTDTKPIQKISSTQTDAMPLNTEREKKIMQIASIGSAIGLLAGMGYAFKNNVFEWISDTPTADTELVVSWSNTSWTFSISDECRLRIKENITIETIPFFVMLSNDFDFLIRTIFINMQDLIAFDKIEKPFESRIEQDITKISIASKIVFQSYGLKIND